MELNDDRSERINYDFKNYPFYIREGLLSSYNGYAAPPHWHDDIELIKILSGDMQYNIDGNIVTLKEGNGLFVNSKALHFGFSNSREECEFICILLHPSILCSSLEMQNDFVSPILKNQNISFIELHNDVEWQNTILKCVDEIYVSKGKESAPLIISGLFFKIFSCIYENIPMSLAKNPNCDLMILKKIVGFVQQNYNTKISLNEIAHAGDVGESKCCKLFKEYIGKTPIGYLTQYRLNKGIELLRDSDMSITEIALSVGFNGNSYFSETFKKNYGTTPSDFKAKERF